MQFLNDLKPSYDLTYNDVFLVPNYSQIKSRFDTDLTSPDHSGANIPLIVANMSAVSGKRMAETIARRGGIAVLPQDIPIPKLKEMLKVIKSRHAIYDTPITLTPTDTIADALRLISKRAYQTIVIVNEQHQPIGLFQNGDQAGLDPYTQLKYFVKPKIITFEEGIKPKTAFEQLHHKRLNLAPVVKDTKLIGVITKKGAIRSTIYQPALNRHKQFIVAVAIGINGDIQTKAQQIIDLGADILVLDTAHGHQQKMIKAIEAVRQVDQSITLVAGNVVTAQGTIDLINAGANIVKVGVGPGAMCTTRMMTGVGRPQFSSVLECSLAAKAHHGYVWADGGIRYPRDVALALAAGASNVMIGSWFAATHESTGQMLEDSDGRLYKESYGMASKKAVHNRNLNDQPYEYSLKEFFEEGISTSKLYINENLPGVEDIIDHIIAGVKSSMTYAGALNLEEFNQKAIVGLQSSSGYQEGKPIATNW